MALIHYDLTLGSGTTQLTTTRKGVRHMWIENVAGNAIVYLGNTSTVSSTNYGRSIPAGAAFLEIGPFSGDAPCYTTEFWFKGTDTQVIHVLVVTH